MSGNQADNLDEIIYNLVMLNEVGDAAEIYTDDAVIEAKAKLTALLRRVERGASEKHQSGNKPRGKQVATFSAEQMIAWSKRQEEFNNPAWTKSQDERDGYAKAMRHLRYYVQNPVSDLLNTGHNTSTDAADAPSPELEAEL